MRRHVPNLGTPTRVELDGGVAYFCGIARTSGPITLTGITDPGYKKSYKKSRRIRMEPCGFELIDYIDVSLPLEHAQPRASL